MYINNSLPLFLIYITQLLLITVLLYYCALVFYFIHEHWDFHSVPIQPEITSSSTLSTSLSTNSWSQNGVRPAHVTQSANQKWDMGWGNFSLSTALAEPSCLTLRRVATVVHRHAGTVCVCVCVVVTWECERYVNRKRTDIKLKPHSAKCRRYGPQGAVRTTIRTETATLTTCRLPIGRLHNAQYSGTTLPCRLGK